MSHSALDSQRYYDVLAAEYRAQDSFWDNPYDREIWRLEHHLLRPHLNLPGALLDLGCGFYPHFEFTKQRPVVAVDVSIGSLRIAKDFGDESQRVRLLQADVRALPFPLSSFAYVIAGGELLNHVPNYWSALREIHRVLKPGGYLLLQVGAKWCLDTVWAIVDAITGHHIGYSMTRQEAKSLLASSTPDIPVTWSITPKGEFTVYLLSISRLRRNLADSGFRIRRTYGANSISGIFPLPIQQEPSNRLVERLVEAVLFFERRVGHLPIFRTFAGNVFFICQSV